MAKWQGGAASEEGLYFFQDLFKYSLESGIAWVYIHRMYRSFGQPLYIHFQSSPSAGEREHEDKTRTPLHLPSSHNTSLSFNFWEQNRCLPSYSDLQNIPCHICCSSQMHSGCYPLLWTLQYSLHFCSFTSVCWAVPARQPCLHPPLHSDKDPLSLRGLAACLWWAFISHVSACKLTRLAGIVKYQFKKLLKRFHGNWASKLIIHLWKSY